MKKILSAILVMAIVCMLVPTFASAAEETEPVLVDLATAFEQILNGTYDWSVFFEKLNSIISNIIQMVSDYVTALTTKA